MPPPDLQWQNDDASVVLTGNGEVGFSDTRDHWENGVIRLLGISDADARAWCEEVMRVSFERYSRSPQALGYEAFVDAVGSGWRRCFPSPAIDSDALLLAAQRHNPSFTSVWADALAHEDGAAVVGTDDPEHGRLVDATSGALVEPAEYEEEYFEGEIEGVG